MLFMHISWTRPSGPATFPRPNHLRREITLMRFISPLLATALIAASLVVSATPAFAVEPSLSGTVTDINTGQPVGNVCVTIGPFIG